MAGYYSGKDGRLYVSDNTGTDSVGQIQNWSFSQSMSVLETTAMGDNDRTLKAGLRSYSGSCRAFYYTPNASGEPNITYLLSNQIKTNTTDNSPSVKLRLRLEEVEGSDSNARDIQFNVFITGVSMSSSVGEISSVDFTWEATGAPIINTIS